MLPKVSIQSLLLGGLLYLPTLAIGSSEIVSVEAMGRGANRAEAINAALVEAVSRVEGINVISERKRSSSSREVVVRDANGSERKIAFDRTMSGSVRTATDGLVESFRILQNRTLDGMSEVQLEVDIASFEAPGSATHTTRRRIAVYPVSASGSYTVLGKKLPASVVSSRLTQRLVEAFTGTRRFAVLERSRSEALDTELEFLTKPVVARREAARIGEAIGADYLVTAQVTDLEVMQSRRTLQLTSEVVREITASLAVNMRIVSTATRQIMWADTVAVNAQELKDLGVEVEQRNQSLTATLQFVAAELTSRAVDAIYPIRIASVTEAGEIVLNQGDNRLSPGDRLDVFKLGEHVTDPYTGESLGREELPVGAVKVDRVTSKVAYASPVDAEKWPGEGSISGGYVVRGQTVNRASVEISELVGNAADPVLLPQDGH
ncbi:hypothetical protein BBH56_03485 [Spiribacter roseus]|uniref:CsgG/HfaB family protein n=1 Tax=Spiribacter roseus TaxID=1855875 RepID=UPI000F6F3F50|nr:hypothetical protein BBH56_03485 [Spiribacter roseus]